MFFKTKNLSFSYYKKPLCLKDINFNLSKGDKCAVVATKDMGKTTLLRVLSGFQGSYFGKILLNNIDLKTISDQDKNFSLIFSEPIFLNRKTIKQNLDYFCEVCGFEAFSEEYINNKLKDFEIEKTASDKLSKLSLLEKRKLMIFRSMLKNPQIIFLDDQLKGLNENESAEMLRLYEKLLRDKTLTIIMAIGESAYREIFSENSNFLFDKFYYLCDANLKKYNNNEEFEKLKENFNMITFLDGYESHLVDLVYENGDYKLAKDISAEVLDEKLFRTKETLNLENFDSVECLFVIKTSDVNGELGLSDMANYLKNHKANLYALLGGEKLI